jgi:ABC-type multidrug transport system ATPase subunit
VTNLRCRNLRVRRKTGFLLEVPRLDLDPGTITAVSGPNGSGKSTLLLACAGLIDLDGGAVNCGDQLIHRGRAPAPAKFRRRTVLVHQDPYLLRGTVRRNLHWGLRLRRVPKTERHRRSAEISSALGIADLMLRQAASLSGGQQTLVAIARALVLRPTVLLLDEVTRDLDANHRLAVVKAIEQRATRDSAVLLATHDRDLMEQLASRQVTLENGKVVVD